MLFNSATIISQGGGTSNKIKYTVQKLYLWRGGEKLNHKEGNYFRVPNDIFGSGIEKRAFIVYCYLSRCSDMKTRQCYPSLKTIAKACNLSVTTVRRALTDLENGGWIDIAQRFTDNGQESNLYTVLNI